MTTDEAPLWDKYAFLVKYLVSIEGLRHKGYDESLAKLAVVEEGLSTLGLPLDFKLPTSEEAAEDSD